MSLRTFFIIAVGGLVFIVTISVIPQLVNLPSPPPTPTTTNSASLKQTPTPGTGSAVLTQPTIPGNIAGKYLLIFGLGLSFLTVLGYLLFLREPSHLKLDNHPAPKHHRV